MRADAFVALQALALCAGLCACGGGSAPAPDPAEPDAANGEATSPAETGVPAEEPEAPADTGAASDAAAPSDEPEAPAAAQKLDLGGVNTIGAVGELTFDGGFSCEKLESPLSAGVHISDSPADGKIFVVLSATFTSAASSKSRVEDLLSAAIAPKGSDAYVTASCYAVTDGGSKLDSYPGQYSIAPLAQGTCYYLMEVPKVVQEGPVTITIYAAGQYYNLAA